jgi:hypothetical protein
MPVIIITTLPASIPAKTDQPTGRSSKVTLPQHTLEVFKLFGLENLQKR